MSHACFFSRLFQSRMRLFWFSSQHTYTDAQLHTYIDIQTSKHTRTENAVSERERERRNAKDAGDVEGAREAAPRDVKSTHTHTHTHAQRGRSEANPHGVAVAATAAAAAQHSISRRSSRGAPRVSRESERKVGEREGVTLARVLIARLRLSLSPSPGPCVAAFARGLKHAHAGEPGRSLSRDDDDEGGAQKSERERKQGWYRVGPPGFIYPQDGAAAAAAVRSSASRRHRRRPINGATRTLPVFLSFARSRGCSSCVYICV